MENQGNPVKSIFEEISPTYDRVNHLLSLNLDRGWRRKALQELGSYGKVLDLCAGTLDMTLEYLKQNPASEVWAVDFSEKMLHHGEKKIPENLRSQIHCVQADATHLPFDSETFSAVFCAYGIRNLPEPSAGLKEIHRVLKPNGFFLTLEFFRPTHPLTRLFHQSYGRLLPVVGGMVSKSRPAYAHLKDSIQHFYSLDEYNHLLKKQYFKYNYHRKFLMGVSHAILAQKI